MRTNKIIFTAAVFCALAMTSWADEDKFPLAISSRNYPHIESLRNGSIQIPECRISYSTMSTVELNRQLDQGSAGDVIEVDFVPYLKRFSKEEKHDWILVPVFLRREFPHRHVVLQSDQRLAIDIQTESILVWAKGILASSPTFKSTDTWTNQMSTASTKSPFFRDSKTAEQNYFRETRIFPIVTVLAVRKELVEANAWLPEALFMAFSEAKSQSLEQGTIPLPWGSEFRDETIELMNKDYWSYGVKNNPKTLGALLKYAHEQGITTTELEPEDLFSLETLMLIDEKGAKN